MPPVGVKLYSVFFKLFLRRRLQSLLHSAAASSSPSSSASGAFGLSCRPEESTSPANPSFSADGIATKDIHIDPRTALSIRIFLPDPARIQNPPARRNSFPANPVAAQADLNGRRASYDVGSNGSAYCGYSPNPDPTRRGGGSRRFPVIIQFHGGAFVVGGNNTQSNDLFCRRIARSCDAMVIAVGYRLAPESPFPAALEDGMKVLHWIAKQANLAGFGKSKGSVDPFGASMVEPWLAAHADPSRCVLLGVSSGANIADHVARRSVESRTLLNPLRVVAQVLLYPFFLGSSPTPSELKLSNSYFYDKPTCLLAWKLFLPGPAFHLDHPAANPLAPGGTGPPLKLMPPTLTVVAEHDWMKDRAIAYSEALRKVNVDAPVLEYKDAVHEFASLDMLLKTPQAVACVEDLAIWVKKYISTRGHEFSY